jgi:hypothetical protein
MTIENAKKKLTNAGFVVSWSSDAPGVFAATHPDHSSKVIEFHRNGRTEDVACIRSRRLGDVGDPMTDYFAGAWHNSLSRAIRSVKG